jgi:hypothetical protein
MLIFPILTTAEPRFPTSLTRVVPSAVKLILLFPSGTLSFNANSAVPAASVLK